MSFRAWVTTIILFGWLLYGSVRVVPYLWKMSPREVPVAPSGWSPFARSLVRAAIRAFPSLMGICAFGAVLFPLGAISSSRHGIWTWAYGVCVGGVVAAFLVAVSVAAFNRPSFVVPPVLRRDRGGAEHVPGS